MCYVHGMIQQFSPTIALLIRSRGFWARRAKLLVAKGCQEVRKFKPLGRVAHVALNRFVECDQNPIKHGAGRVRHETVINLTNNPRAIENLLDFNYSNEIKCLAFY